MRSRGFVHPRPLAFASCIAIGLAGSACPARAGDRELSSAASSNPDVEHPAVPIHVATAEAAPPSAEDARVGPRDVRQPISMREMVEQIMITARKREEDQQRAPVAVTAFSARDIEVSGARRLQDLDAIAPNLAFSNALGAASSGRLSLRGVGQGDLLATTDPGVAVYVDGVYTPRAQGQLRALTDVERVEVLRGPQGTLFGKNTIGGAIDVITRRPTFNTSGQAQLRVGNYGTLETRLSGNIPLIPEVAAARVSLASSYDEGWQKNSSTGRRGATERLLAGQGKLLFLPSDDVEVLLAVDFTREHRRPQASRCKTVPLEGREMLTNTTLLAASSGQLAACAADAGLSYRRFASDVTARDDLDAYGLSTQVRWDVSENLAVKSITAIRHQDIDFAGDGDATSVNFAQPQLGTMSSKQRLWSQEIQLNGQADLGRINYVLGVFVFGETVTANPIGNLIFPDAMANDLAVLDERLKVNNRSLAVYADISYALTDRLTISAGLRRTMERKRVRKRDVFETSGRLLGTEVEVPAGLLAFSFEESKRFSKYTPMASIRYELTSRAIAYASFTTGFRSGGFNGRANWINPDITPVSPEDLTSYEIGIKSVMFEDRLRVNASLFTSSYEDIQRTVVTPVDDNPGVALRNAAEATLRGAELEVTAVPFRGLTLSSAVGLFRARYRDFDFSGDPGIDDARFENAPNLTLNLAMDYSFVMSSLGLLNTRLEWTQQGKKANSASDLREIRTSRYGLLDGRIALEMNDGRTEIAIYGENLLNRRYFDNGVDLASVFGYVLRFPGSPRRYGIEVTRSF